MTRLLYIITELDVGGAENALCELATRLDRQAFQPEVACLYGEGPLAGRLRARGVDVHPLGARGKWDLRVLWRLRRLLRRADLAHSFLFHANMVTRVAAIGAGLAAVVSSARIAERSRPRRRSLERWTHRLIDAQVCVSTGVRDWYAAGGFPTHKLLVIPNGVDVDRFAGRDPAFKTQLGLPADTPLVTAIGRLHEQKGMEFFLRAAASVRHSRPDCHFLLIGRGPLEGKLRAQARELRLDDHVTFLDFCGQIPDVLKATDVFVLPSLWEGMPNVVLEAMAAAVPVVATRVEGVADIIEHGKTGLLLMPKDIPSLSSSTRRLLDEPGRARAIGEAAQAHVRASFSIEATVRRHHELYARLLSS
jgi:starch synthase (maltosyl-transferring)